MCVVGVAVDMGLEAERPDSENPGLNRYGLIENLQILNGACMKGKRGLNKGDGGWCTRIGLVWAVAHLFTLRYKVA